MSVSISDLYHTPLEAGIRAVVVLEHLRPITADLSEVVLYDHVVVHASDVGGPMSLHAAVSGRRGELLVRRGIVEAGLDLMRRCHLLEKVADDEGFTWRASEEAASYVELLESSYSEDLKTCASWLAEQVRELSKAGFKSMVVGHIGEWTESFGHGTAQAGA
ncbi:ABC-three component system middle component 2 [Bosea sp. ASV33]|uniref:ABC-three component system middle component 2 n=1 Tax=Bosea sp. ASV33 TaxID=2795106 RepID=UPI0018EB78EA|nr:ABC-three component system middle component 2 [Bosea sp. ASV33]